MEKLMFKILPVVFYTLFIGAAAIAEPSLREQMALLPEQHGWHPGAGSLDGAAPIPDSDIAQFPDLPDGCAAESTRYGSKPNEVWLGQCVLEQQEKKAFANMLWDDVTATTKKVCVASARQQVAGRYANHPEWMPFGISSQMNFYPALAACLKGRANIEDVLRAADKAGSNSIPPDSD
jgi:hypothetical protein